MHFPGLILVLLNDALNKFKVIYCWLSKVVQYRNRKITKDEKEGQAENISDCPSLTPLTLMPFALIGYDFYKQSS